MKYPTNHEINKAVADICLTFEVDREDSEDQGALVQSRQTNGHIYHPWRLRPWQQSATDEWIYESWIEEHFNVCSDMNLHWEMRNDLEVYQWYAYTQEIMRIERTWTTDTEVCIRTCRASPRAHCIAFLKAVGAWPEDWSDAP